jgi:hypothetical protein
MLTRTHNEQACMCVYRCAQVCMYALILPFMCGCTHTHENIKISLWNSALNPHPSSFSHIHKTLIKRVHTQNMVRQKHYTDELYLTHSLHLFLTHTEHSPGTQTHTHTHTHTHSTVRQKHYTDELWVRIQETSLWYTTLQSSCRYIYIYIYIYTYIHTYIHIYILYDNTIIYTQTHTHIYEKMHTCVCVSVCRYACVAICLRDFYSLDAGTSCMYVCMYLCMQRYIYACMSVWVSVCMSCYFAICIRDIYSEVANTLRICMWRYMHACMSVSVSVPTCCFLVIYIYI